jgi:hypothetical protein
LYCKSSQGVSVFLLFLVENHSPKNELKISHKSTSTPPNHAPEKGLEAPEVLQNISYCLLLESSLRIS